MSTLTTSDGSLKVVLLDFLSSDILIQMVIVLPMGCGSITWNMNPAWAYSMYSSSPNYVCERLCCREEEEFCRYASSAYENLRFAKSHICCLVPVWILVTLCFDLTLLPNIFFSVPFRHGERIGFSYLVSQKYTRDNAAIKVLRISEVLNFNMELASHKRLIPAHNRGRPPSYYIIAGFVFTRVSVPYLRSEVCNFLLLSLLVFLSVSVQCLF